MRTLINIEKGMVAIVGEYYSANTVQLKDIAYHFDFGIQYGNESMQHAHIQVDKASCEEISPEIVKTHGDTNVFPYLLAKLQVTEPNAIFFDEDTGKLIECDPILLEKSEPSEFEGEFKFE